MLTKALLLRYLESYPDDTPILIDARTVGAFRSADILTVKTLPVSGSETIRLIDREAGETCILFR